MKDEFDFEDELAESIAHIIDEETSSAESIYRDEQHDSDGDEGNITDTDSEEEEGSNGNSSRNRLIIIIASIVVFIGIVVGLAVFFIKTALNNSKNNYGYYQNLAYKAMDDDKDYVQAIEYFKKAMKYKDSLLEDENIDVSGMMVSSKLILVKDLLNMCDCYEELHMSDEKTDTLKMVLQYDSDNENAVYYLIKEYEKTEDYAGIKAIYDNLGDDAESTVTAMFSKYLCAEPVIAPEAGKYGKKQEIEFLNRDGCKIYYTVDGSDPVENGTLFNQDFFIEEGKTTVRYYMVNEFGFKSEVYTAEYEIVYKAPDMPKVSPQSGSYSTSSEQMITIGNIPGNAKAYYEISYSGTPSKPTTSSNEYTAPFAMPEGSIILSVIIIDENGLSSEIVTNNYTLKKVDKYSDTMAETLIWSTLELHKAVDKNHMTGDGKKAELLYYSRKEIGEQTVWMFSVNIEGETQEYYYGCDADTGKVYKITTDKDKNEYILKEMKY